MRLKLTHDHIQEIPELAFGGFQVFSVIKITMIRQESMLPACKREDKEEQNAAQRAKIVNAFVLHYFCVCGQQKPNDPQIEPHG